MGRRKSRGVLVLQAEQYFPAVPPIPSAALHSRVLHCSLGAHTAQGCTSEALICLLKVTRAHPVGTPSATFP